VEPTLLTFIDAEAGERPLEAWRDAGRLVVEPDALARATGWALKPEGLCRNDVCVPVRDRDALVVETDDGARIDVAAFATALHRLAVIDVDEGVVALGAPAAERASLLAAGRAPDFELPDLDGGSLRLTSVGRKKKLLLAWASW
jgi:hypothetical protein